MRPFLFHIRPRFFCPHEVIEPAKLLELRIEELGIHLKGNDLRTGHPYPNKSWYVGHRKIGRKAVDGILLSFSDWPPKSFEVSARWQFSEEKYERTLKIIYMLLDKDFGAASENYSLWNAASCEACTFKDRWPTWARDDDGKPITDVFPKPMPERTVIDDGHFIEETAAFVLPTIEPERILGPDYPRERIALPTLEMAITL